MINTTNEEVQEQSEKLALLKNKMYYIMGEYYFSLTNKEKEIFDLLMEDEDVVIK